MTGHVGLDFGTTNSTLAVADPDGDIALARFDHRGVDRETFRSLLHFWSDDRPGAPIIVEAGPRAIEQYLEFGTDGRLIQSVKTFLASRSFRETMLCGRRHTLEDLIALLLGRLREAAEARLGALGRRAAVGRPVRFAGQGRPGDEQMAEARLRRALARVGFEDVVFVFEPVAAAYHYELGLDHDELVLIADFGGGTSDFSLLRVGPRARQHARAERAVLANDGVAVAGDSFDAQIARYVVSPALGRGTEYEAAFGKRLEIPLWVFSHLEQWHTLSFLKTPRNLQLLRRLIHDAEAPERLEWLLFLVENDLGFGLHEAIDAAKTALSEHDTATLVFEPAPLRIRAEVTRGAFETWIRRELEAIADCADRTLRAANVIASDVDRVFMTGGSSFVPAVRAIFETRFGADRLRYGGEFVSVARGLALAARDVFAG